MHYQRQRRGADMDAPEERRGLCFTERLWQHIDVRGWNECWEWTAGRNEQGYGQFHLLASETPERRRKTVIAHRMAYQTYWRRLLENWGLHECNNPPCCNPLHVYDGTPSENQHDSIAAGTAVVLRKGWRRTARGERAGLAKLTDDAIKKIRARYVQGGVTQQKLADEYGVNQTQISNIVHRKTWRHVE